MPTTLAERSATLAPCEPPVGEVGRPVKPSALSRFGRSPAGALARRTLRRWAATSTALAALLAVGGCADGMAILPGANASKAAGDSDASEEMQGAYAKLPRDVCQPLAKLGVQLVPGATLPRPARKSTVASCDFTNTRDTRRHRALFVRIDVLESSYDFEKDAYTSPDEEAKAAFKPAAADARKGGLGSEHVKDSRSVPGLGDEAAVVYATSDLDAGVARVIVRKRNLLVSVTFQGSNNETLEADDGSGYISVATPLAKDVAEDGALRATRTFLGQFQ
jgi:hypothetical protein